MSSSISFGKLIPRSLLVMVGVIVANLLVGAIIILLIGSDPQVAFRALLASSLGDPEAITNVLTRAAPLVLSGLAVAVAFTAGIFNLGGEGQLYLGALAAAVVGFTLDLPAVLHLPLVLAAAMLAGAIGAWLPGWLRVHFDVDEVISTLLLNPVFVLFTGYLANGPFRDPQRWSGTTPQINVGARLPVLWQETGLNLGIVLSALAVGLVFFLLSYSEIGYRWRMTGLNATFTRYGGTDDKRSKMGAMLLSGALAGLAGGVLVCGSQFRFWAQIGAGIGWDGVLMALLAQNGPFGVLLAGLGFAVIKTGSLGMEIASNVPSELTNVLLALMILLVTGRHFIGDLLARARKQTRPEVTDGPDL